MVEGEWSVLETGLIDLNQATDPMISFYYKTHQNSEDVFNIWVAKDYGTPENIATIDLDNTKCARMD